MAGILNHLPALMAITTPSLNSYRRIRPHCWSGAFRCWGFDNREAAIRVPTHPEAPVPTHFELKTVDASSNPYLALGALSLRVSTECAAVWNFLKRSWSIPAPFLTLTALPAA